MVDSRSELAVSSTRALRFASLRPTARISAGDCAPFRFWPRRSSFHVATTICFCELTRSSIEPVWPEPGHRLTLRQGEFLFERPDFEEEDVAAPLVRSAAARDIPRAHVVGDEVAGPHVEILEVHGVANGDARVAARHRRGARPVRTARERHTPAPRVRSRSRLRLAPRCPLLPGGVTDRSLAGFTMWTSGGAVFERSNEILGLAGIGQALADRAARSGTNRPPPPSASRRTAPATGPPARIDGRSPSSGARLPSADRCRCGDERRCRPARTHRRRRFRCAAAGRGLPGRCSRRRFARREAGARRSPRRLATRQNPATTRYLKPERTDAIGRRNCPPESPSI